MIGYFDGSCEPKNPGGTAKFGWCLMDRDTQEIGHYGYGVIGKGEGMTCNVAEYHALVELLKHIKENQIEVDCVCGDSSLVVNMVTGKWGKKNPHKKAPHLKVYLLEAQRLIDELKVEVRWIPREENVWADYYSKL